MTSEERHIQTHPVSHSPVLVLSTIILHVSNEIKSVVQFNQQRSASVTIQMRRVVVQSKVKVKKTTTTGPSFKKRKV